MSTIVKSLPSHFASLGYENLPRQKEKSLYPSPLNSHFLHEPSPLKQSRPWWRIKVISINPYFKFLKWPLDLFVSWIIGKKMIILPTRWRGCVASISRRWTGEANLNRIMSGHCWQPLCSYGNKVYTSVFLSVLNNLRSLETVFVTKDIISRGKSSYNLSLPAWTRECYKVKQR